MPAGFVYILATKPYGTLYIGVTSDIPGRMEAHRLGESSSFVRRYSVSQLVYFEEYPLYADAIRRETNLKKMEASLEGRLDRKGQPGMERPARNLARLSWMAGSEAGHGERGR